MPDSFWAALAIALVTAGTQLVGIMLASKNHAKVESSIQELHIQVNSNQQKQIEASVKAAVAEALAAGILQGRAEGHAEGLALGHATALSEERASPSAPIPVEKAS